MTSEAANASQSFRNLRPALTWGLFAIVALILMYFIAGRVERLVTRWPQSSQTGVSPAHCAAFVALAKATYGTDWKARLDPTDTTCATEVQQAWEQERISREVEIQPSLVDVPASPAPLPQPVAQPVQQTRAETYCLNVISLAKSRYGADWANKIDDADRAACVRP